MDRLFAAPTLDKKIEKVGGNERARCFLPIIPGEEVYFLCISQQLIYGSRR